MEYHEMGNALGRAGTITGTGIMNAAVNLLNDLIATNLGISDVYETAAARLESEAYAEMLRGAAGKHATFAQELTDLVVRRGGTPVTNAGGSSLVKRAWVALKAATTQGDGPILAEVARDAENILESYGAAMGADLPEDARVVIRRHMREARLTYEKLLPLSVALNS